MEKGTGLLLGVSLQQGMYVQEDLECLVLTLQLLYHILPSNAEVNQV